MSAIISECGRYRYRLERELNVHSIPEITAAVIMVNPSTADAETDDATIRKLKGFGERNGWSRIIVGNLFAYRTTDVRALGKVIDPIGPLNNEFLLDIIAESDVLLFAWGPVAKQPPGLRGRWRVIRDMAIEQFKQPMCIGATAKDGHPRHPLMLAYAEPIIPWEPQPL